MALAVPPVETSSTPCAASARANSIRPVLSETDNRARVTRRVVSVMGKVLCQGILMPRRAAIVPALPDGAPSKVASRARAGWLAAFGRGHNGAGSGSSGVSRTRMTDFLQRQFRLALGGAAGRVGRRGRAHEAPA